MLIAHNMYSEGDGFPFPLFFAIDKSRQNIYYRKQCKNKKNLTCRAGCSPYGRLR